MNWDLTQLPMEVRRKIDEIVTQDTQLKLLQAVKRQTLLAKRNYDQAPRAIDGFGGKVLQVDAFLDAFWRRAYGPNYSENPDLINFLKRRNPEIVVRHTGTKIQIGWRPNGQRQRLNIYNTYDFRKQRPAGIFSGGESAAPKFRKVYSLN